MKKLSAICLTSIMVVVLVSIFTPTKNDFSKLASTAPPDPKLMITPFD